MSGTRIINEPAFLTDMVKLFCYLNRYDHLDIEIKVGLKDFNIDNENLTEIKDFIVDEIQRFTCLSESDEFMNFNLCKQLEILNTEFLCGSYLSHSDLINLDDYERKKIFCMMLSTNEFILAIDGTLLHEKKDFTDDMMVYDIIEHFEYFIKNYNIYDFDPLDYLEYQLKNDTGLFNPYINLLSVLWLLKLKWKVLNVCMHGHVLSALTEQKRKKTEIFDTYYKFAYKYKYMIYHPNILNLTDNMMKAIIIACANKEEAKENESEVINC